MPINRADVIETKFFKQRARRNHTLDMLLGALSKFKYWRHAFQHFFAAASHGRIKTSRHQLGKIIIERTHWPRDGHVIVIEDHQQVGIHRTSIVKCLECHAAAHCAITNDSHSTPIAPINFRRYRHSQSCADRCTSVRGTEGIVYTLSTIREAGNTTCHAQGFHRFAPSRKYLVRIGLVTHIPHQSVIRCIKNVVQCNG